MSMAADTAGLEQSYSEYNIITTNIYRKLESDKYLLYGFRLSTQRHSKNNKEYYHIWN